ncbi:MAG TPA: flippase [Chryseosolibacter sp.]|nr:flippase [Chryseosolibacter sp.]
MSMLSRASVAGLALVNVFFLVRILSKQDFGIWVLYLSITAVVEMMKQGFVKNPFITTWIRAGENDKREVLGSSIVLNFTLTLVLSAVVCAVSKPLSVIWAAPGIETLFYLYAFHNFLLIPLFYFENLQTIQFKFNGILIATIVRNGMLTAFIVHSFYIDAALSLVHLAVVQMAATAMAAIVSYFSASNLLRQKPRISRTMFLQMFHLGKFTFGTNISSMVIKSTDSWMLGKLASPAAVAIYNPAIRLSNIFEVPTMSVASVVFPKMAMQMKQNGKHGVKNMYEKSVSLMLALIIPIVVPFFIFSEQIITSVFGPDYSESIPILEITILYSLIVPFNRQFGTVLDALQKPRLNFYLLLCTALLNIVLNYVFFLSFGIIGCAIGTLVSFSIIFIVNQVILFRSFSVSVPRILLSVGEWYLAFGKLVWRKASALVTTSFRTQRH